ncbi:TIGR03759 family integrating conjugative element protein (plasmid) [Microbulbifer sp. TRSA002]|uniref:TIGR03759 family integrating conjugative element protein n=1 Tax=Microbulbifer sp. TRSA002 TaxID=3243382 RepID=UPI00403953B5
MNKLAYIVLGLAVSTYVYANNQTTQGNNSATVISDMKSTLDKETAVTLTEKDKNLAKQWMLLETDWVKYKEIMSGPRGIWSPGLDPITALGVSETDPQERKRYAELWIKIESRRAELEMAFEVERQRAASRVLGDQLAVNNSSWIRQWEQKQVEVNKQVVLFVDSNCKEDCKTMFEELHASVGDNARLDIYFKQGATSEGIGQWASFMKIPPEVVRSREVTLNFDEGRSAELEVDMAALPQVRVIDVKSGAIKATYK